MTELHHAPGYQRWKESVLAFLGAALDRHSGFQSGNAARAETLRHIRETHASLSDTDAKEIWSATGCCGQCGRAIQPGYPYLDHTTEGEHGPRQVLVCCECEFEPTIFWVNVTRNPATLPKMSVSEVRDTALAGLNRCRYERWARQDRLRHRGPVWRVRRYVDWWIDNWVLLQLAPLPPLLRRALCAVGMRRMRRMATGSGQARLPWQRAGEALLRRYGKGQRGFARAELARTRLRGALLARVNFSLADLTHADLADADLSDVRLDRADLEHACLSSANLRHASLRGANLYRAFLARANLEGADLSGADLSAANLYMASVTEEQLAQAASLKGALLPDGTLQE